MLEIGRRIAAGLGGVPADALDEYVAHAARKRVGFIVEPTRVVSWDHGKLVPPAGLGARAQLGHCTTVHAPARVIAPVPSPGTTSSPR